MLTMTSAGKHVTVDNMLPPTLGLSVLSTDITCFIILPNSTLHSRRWHAQHGSSRASIAHTVNTKDSRRVGGQPPLFRIALEVTGRGGARHKGGEKSDSANDKRPDTWKKPPIGESGDAVCLSVSAVASWITPKVFQVFSGWPFASRPYHFKFPSM